MGLPADIEGLGSVVLQIGIERRVHPIGVGLEVVIREFFEQRVVYQVHEKGRFDLVTDVTRAGRHPESDIFLDDITVSRRHAEFMKSHGGYTVRDVGSLNGTYVNRERIEEAVLSSGDEVQIGKFKLVYLAAADE